MRHTWIPWAVAAVVGVADAAEGPVKSYRVVAPKDDGVSATGINGRGEIVGFEWVEEKDRPGVMTQAAFFARGKVVTYLPLLTGYTATFPAAVSDGGLVVGRASKPAQSGVAVHLRNQAFVWDEKGGMLGLGVPTGDNGSFACGVSRDGRRVSGIAGGPDRVRACVWDYDGDAKLWMVSVLPHEGRLGSNVVPISDDGRRIAAVDGVTPCLWSRTDAGVWTRETIGEPGSILPRGVNDSGTVVGLRHADKGLTHAVVRTRDRGVTTLAEPAGFVKSEANAVNNAGAIVGMVDGPNGSKTGPRAFVFESGRLRLLDEGGPHFTAATAVNDHGEVTGVMEHDDEPEQELNRR